MLPFSKLIEMLNIHKIDIQKPTLFINENLVPHLRNRLINNIITQSTTAKATLLNVDK